VKPRWRSDARLQRPIRLQIDRCRDHSTLHVAHRYRNHDRDFAYLSQYADRKIHQPSLFIGGSRDLVLTMFGKNDFVTPMKEHLTDLRGHDVLEGCGHWTQQERPAEVNARLIPWLKGL